MGRRLHGAAASAGTSTVLASHFPSHRSDRCDWVFSILLPPPRRVDHYGAPPRITTLQWQNDVVHTVTPTTSSSPSFNTCLSHSLSHISSSTGGNALISAQSSNKSDIPQQSGRAQCERCQETFNAWPSAFQKVQHWNGTKCKARYLGE